MKCISIDLDGTLLNSKQEISEENIKALNELQEQGHCAILNTGRAFADVVKLDAVKHLKVPIFCINGAVLYSDTRELLYEATIPVETYRGVFSILKELGVGILVYTNDGGFPTTLPYTHDKSKEELRALFQGYNYDKVLEIDNLQIYKIIALVSPNQVDKIEEVKVALGNKFDITMASSFPNNLEITSNEAHKGKALLRYQQMMNLSFDEIIAIGDGGNDLAQFEVANISIAMGNAPDSIKNQADMVTKINDEDGFAYAMREQLKLIPAKTIV